MRVSKPTARFDRRERISHSVASPLPQPEPPSTSSGETSAGAMVTNASAAAWAPSADDHLLLLGDRSKLQLQAQHGGVFPHMWHDDSHLLATWREAASPHSTLYLVNLAQPGLRQLAQGTGDFQVQRRPLPARKRHYSATLGCR